MNYKLNGWLTLSYNTISMLLTLALFAFGAFIAWQRSIPRHRLSSILNLILVAAFCWFILGSGFVIEPIVRSITDANTTTLSPLYFTLYHTQDYISNQIQQIILGGLPCGILLSLLLHSRYGRSQFGAAKCAVISLVIFDCLNFAHLQFTLYPYNHAILGNLLFDIGSDIIGGGIAGVACWWFAHRVGDNQPSVKAKLLRKAIALTTLTSAVVFIGLVGFYVVLRPVSSGAILAVRDFQDAKITYGWDNAVLRNQNESWVASPDNLHFSTRQASLFGDVQGAEGTVAVEVRSELSCSNPHDALLAAQSDSSDPKRAEIPDSRLVFSGFVPELSVAAPQNDDQGPNFSISMPSQKEISISARSDRLGRSITSYADATATLPLTVGEYLLFSTAELGPVDEKHLPNFSLGFNKPGSSTSIFDAKVSSSFGYCQHSRMSESYQGHTSLERILNAYQRSYVVIRILAAPKTAKIQLALSGVSMDVSDGFRFAATPPDLTLVSLTRMNVNEGVLSVGSTKYSLSRGDSVVLAGNLNLTQYDDGTVGVEGQSSFVTLNGSLLSKSLFFGLPVELQVTILTALAGAAAVFRVPQLRRRVLSWLGADQ